MPTFAAGGPPAAARAGPAARAPAGRAPASPATRPSWRPGPQAVAAPTPVRGWPSARVGRGRPWSPGSGRRRHRPGRQVVARPSAASGRELAARGRGPAVRRLRGLRAATQVPRPNGDAEASPPARACAPRPPAGRTGRTPRCLPVATAPRCPGGSRSYRASPRRRRGPVRAVRRRRGGTGWAPRRPSGPTCRSTPHRPPKEPGGRPSAQERRARTEQAVSLPRAEAPPLPGWPVGPCGGHRTTTHRPGRVRGARRSAPGPRLRPGHARSIRPVPRTVVRRRVLHGLVMRARRLPHACHTEQRKVTVGPATKADASCTGWWCALVAACPVPTSPYGEAGSVPVAPPSSASPCCPCPRPAAPRANVRGRLAPVGAARSPPAGLTREQGRSARALRTAAPRRPGSAGGEHPSGPGRTPRAPGWERADGRARHPAAGRDTRWVRPPARGALPWGSWPNAAAGSGAPAWLGLPNAAPGSGAPACAG